jgi:tetratricopeptide (TPR) repeat protein
VQQCLAISPRATAQRFSSAAAAWDHFFLQYNEAADLGDHLGARQFAHAMVTRTEFHLGTDDAYAALEREEAPLNHDTANSLSDSTDHDATRILREGTDYYVAMPNALTAYERGDFQMAVSLCEQLIRGLQGEREAAVNRQQIQRRVYPLLAQALARLGRDADAESLLKEIPSDDYDGLLARAHIAMWRRDYPGAQTSITEAVRIAPSIPRAYSDWGDLLAARGDHEAAISKYAEAHRRGPHFAEPLKGWGEELAKAGKRSDAAAKYDEALKYAPSWLALKDARAALGKL